MHFDEEDEITEYYGKVDMSFMADQKKLVSYNVLFARWNLLGLGAANYIHTYYTYFGVNHTLKNMLKIFEEHEMYEKCAIVRDWIKGIDQIEQIKVNNKIT